MTMLSRQVTWNLLMREWKSQWKYWMALVLAFSIPLSQSLSLWIMIALVVAAFWGRPIITLELAWDNLIYLLLLTIGLAYSNDVEYGIEVIETSLSLIAFPLALTSLVPLREGRLFGLLVAFFVGISFSGLLCVANAIWKFYQTGFVESFQYYELTSILDFQPTYFAYFLIFGITTGLYLISYAKGELPSIVIGSLIVFQFGILVLTGGRTSFVSILLIFSFFVLKYLLGARLPSQRFAVRLVAAMLVSLFIVFTLGDLDPNLSDSWDRYELWKSALNANTDLLFGVGTGDFRVVLNQYFVSSGLNRYAVENLNAHNQYIQTFLSGGLIGLASLLLIIGRPLYMAFRRDNALAILLLFPFLVYGMTEVFLGRFQGVLFFAFARQIFVNYLYTTSIMKQSTEPGQNHN